MGAAADHGQLFLPLSLESFVQFESFARALGDPAVRAKRADTVALPVSVQQLVSMVNDPQFISHTHEVLAAFDQWVRGQQSKDNFLATAGILERCVTSTYPDALAALVTSSSFAYPQYSVRIASLRERIRTIRQGAEPCHPIATYDATEAPGALDDWFATSWCVMATYGAVVNLGVYSNVAVALFVAVAIAVAVVLVVPAV